MDTCLEHSAGVMLCSQRKDRNIYGTEVRRCKSQKFTWMWYPLQRHPKDLSVRVLGKKNWKLGMRSIIFLENQQLPLYHIRFIGDKHLSTPPRTSREE